MHREHGGDCVLAPLSSSPPSPSAVCPCVVVSVSACVRACGVVWRRGLSRALLYAASSSPLRTRRQPFSDWAGGRKRTDEQTQRRREAHTGYNDVCVRPPLFSLLRPRRLCVCVPSSSVASPLRSAVLCSAAVPFEPRDAPPQRTPATGTGRKEDDSKGNKGETRNTQRDKTKKQHREAQCNLRGLTWWVRPVHACAALALSPHGRFGPCPSFLLAMLAH
jgi:hypothetical protein